MKMDRKTKEAPSSKQASDGNKNDYSASRFNGNRAEPKRNKPSDIQFANIIEKINEGFVALDAQMNYTYINQRGGELLKRNPEDLIGKNYWDEYPEDKNTSFGQAYLRALETQTPIELEGYYAARDRWFENRIYPFDDGLSIFFNDVTERKLAEEQLSRTASFDEAVMSNMGEGLYTVDSEGLVTSLNAAAEKLFGWTLDELRGRRMHDVTHYKHPDGTPFPAEDCAGFQVLHHGQVLANYEDVFIHKDGTFFNVVYSSSPLWENGKINGLVVVFRDITERKYAELALNKFARQQEALYQLTDQLHRTKTLEDVFNAALDAILSALKCHRASILLFDDTGVMRFVAWRGLSDGYLKATDGHSPWKPDEKTPAPISMNDVDTAELSDSLRAVVKEEGIGSLAFIPLVFNGKLIGKFMAYFNVPHAFSEGETELSLTIARQLAVGIERKRDEDALRTSEARLRIATQAARMFTWEFDLQKQISTVADNFADAVGFSSDLIPKDNQEILQRFIHPEDTQIILEALTKAIQSRSDLPSIQYRILNPESGQPVWLEMNGKIIYDSDGNPERMFGVAQNISENKQGENRLALLAEVSELLRKFEYPIELTFEVSKAIGKHLQVKRCLFNETDVEKDLEIVHRDYHNGVESVAGEHKISDYSSITSAEIAAGKTVVNYDSKTDERTADDYKRTYAPNGERAYVAVPLMRENQWVGTLWVSDDKPRQWTQEEVSLLETIAERTWTVVEKLRINADLRESEERYRFIVENTSDGIWHIELTEPMPISLPENEQLDWYYEHAVIRQCNLGLAHMYGYDSVQEVLGLPLREVMPRENPVNLDLSRQFIRSGYRLVDAESRETSRDGRELVFLNNMVGVIEDDKLTGEWGTNRDITERKRMEEERDQLLEREQAQRASAEQAKIEAEQAWVEAERELEERKLAEAALGEWADAPLPQDKRPAWLRYAVAILVTLIAVMVRVLFNPLLGDALELVTIYGAVAFSVWYGGVGPAFLSVVLGYVAITGLIIEPRHIFVLNGQSTTGLALFLFSNTVVMALGETMRRAQRHAHQSARVAVERQHQAETQLREKQLAEASLRQSEALYRGIARSIPGGGVYVVDKDFQYLVAEGPVTEAFGLSREVLEGHRVDEVFPKEPAERMEARLRKNFAGETVDFETEHNGRVYWTQQAPMVDSLGNADKAIIMTIDITERKQTEEALRRSEERFARFMQYLPGLAWIKDVEGRYIYANAAAEKAFNTPREKLYGSTDEDIFPPEVAAQFKMNDELALRDGKGMQVVETLEHDDGILHYSLVSKFPIPGPDGNMNLIGGTAFDITERKQAEEALRESEERFHAILRQATAGIVRKDAEGRLTFVNQAFCNMLGYTESDLLGKTIWELTHVEDLEENKRLYDRTMMEGIPFKLEKRLIRQDGSTLWVDVSVSPIMDAMGKPQSAVAVEVDITKRKQAEQALSESERRFREMIDALPTAIYTTDAEGRLTHFNPAAAEFSGRVPELGTDHWCVSWKLYYPDGTPMPHDECPMAIALKEGRAVRGVEAIAERPDGSRVWFEPYPTPLRDGAGSIVGGINMLVDITERKQAEDALQQMNLQLESRVQKRTVELQTVNQSLRDEIAERLKAEDALHESRKRLQILSQRLVDVQEEERRAIARELHDRVGQSLSALNINLVILDNQISSHVPEPVSARLDDSMQLVAETINLVRDVMSDLRPPVLDDYGLEAALQSHVNAFKSRYGIDVQFEKPDQPIPRLGASIEMTFLRIAQEALINVARHAKADQITLSLKRDDKVVRLIVQDNGSGIKSWQDANRPGSHGLTIMRERAEAFGGDLKVSSAPESGTKVEASIPIGVGGQGDIQKERYV